MSDSFDRKTEINARVQARWDQLAGEAKHGFYETLFKIVHEEREAAVSEERELCIKDILDVAISYENTADDACEAIRARGARGG